MIRYYFFFFFIGLIIYTYLGYPFVLYIISKIIRIKKSKNISTDMPKVTLIIPAYNEEKIIESKIKNSVSLDYPKDKLEIIVGSDGSSDLTNSIVKKYEDKGIILDYRKQRVGKVRVIKRCVKRASGDIIIFSDANSIMCKDVLNKFAHYFLDPSVGCVCGVTRHIRVSKGHAIQTGEGVYYNLENLVKILEGHLGSVVGATDGFFAIRKNLFSTLTETRGDDLEIPILIRLSGFKVLYGKDIVAKEESSGGFREQHMRRTRMISWNIISLMLLLKYAIHEKKLLISVQLISHKLLRWLVPFFIIIVFLQSVLIRSFFFNIVLGLNLLFFLTAMLGAFSHRSNSKLLRLFHISYSFYAMNYSSFIGVIKGIFNMQTELWEKTR